MSDTLGTLVTPDATYGVRGVMKHDGAYMWCWAETVRVPTKRVEGIGPHASAHDSGGPTHSGTHPHTHTNARVATPTGTHATQVPANTTLDTTSRK